MVNDRYRQQQERRKTTYVIEVFHVKNPASGQEMTVELRFDSHSPSYDESSPLFPVTGRIRKRDLRRAKIYGAGCPYSASVPLMRAPSVRRRLPAELMLEAYRFLDRYSLDVGQLVCDEWRGKIERLSQQLALYALSAWFKHVDFKKEPYGFWDHEWLASFDNYSECFGEVNRRTFLFLESQPPSHSSAVIRRHLRNAFVRRMPCNVTNRDFGWNAAMLLGLADSTLVETLELSFMLKECHMHRGRFEKALVRRKVRKLKMTILDPLLKTLVTHHNFFRKPAIQQLKMLELSIEHRSGPLEPYWLPAIYELNGCQHFAVRYGDVDVTLIRSDDLHAMLENFETSGRDLAVDHFSLFSNLGNPSLATDRRPAYEGIPVPLISTFDTDRWNVYYYETADMKHCLTLFVEPENDRHRTIGLKRLHIKRGKITDFT